MEIFATIAVNYCCKLSIFAVYKRLGCTPLLQLEMAASAFLHMAASNKHIFTFLKLLQLSKCCHSFFLKKLKQYIKETRFYHHTFQFFMCDDLSFVNTTQKTF